MLLWFKNQILFFYPYKKKSKIRLKNLWPVNRGYLVIKQRNEVKRKIIIEELNRGRRFFVALSFRSLYPEANVGPSAHVGQKEPETTTTTMLRNRSHQTERERKRELPVKSVIGYLVGSMCSVPLNTIHCSYIVCCPRLIRSDSHVWESHCCQYITTFDSDLGRYIVAQLYCIIVYVQVKVYLLISLEESYPI